MCIDCNAPSADPGRLNRRRLLQTGAAAGLGLAVAAKAAPAEAEQTRSADYQPRGVTLRWLGVAGWHVEFDGRSLLIDPYLSRFEYRKPGKADINPDAPIRTNRRTIERILARDGLRIPPDFILLTHSHWDHIADVPYLLNRDDPVHWSGPKWRGHAIRTVCAETHWHLLAGLGVHRSRLESVIVASGGERLRYPPGPEWDAPQYTIEVVRSLHSQSAGYGYFAPGTLTARPKRPKVIGDLVEGGSLGYRLSARGTTVLFLSGTANFSEREVAGPPPDVLVLGMSGYGPIDAYTARALELLRPTVVIPDHPDDMVTSLFSPHLGQSVNTAAVAALRDTVRRLGMTTTVLDPRHLEPIAL